MGDTDLWYHLNGGRYILEHLALPRDSFFSFMTSPREWVDYYWLFQVLVYRIHAAWGYPGLIFLRGTLFFAATLVLLAYLYRNTESDTPRFYLAMLFFLYFFFLLPRYQLVRPHLFSYLFILIFLFLLDFRPTKAYALPLLAVLWVNLHGIYYPVLLLTVSAYLLEWIAERVANRTFPRKETLAFAVPALLALLAPLATPHGVSLLSVPWTSIRDASRYIEEFHGLSLSDFLSFHITDLVPSHTTLMALLAWAVVLSAITAIGRRRLRFSHGILLAGGAFLLSKGYRFSHEFLLLSLPLLRSHPLWPSVPLHRLMPRPAAWALTAGVLVIPFVWVFSSFANPPRYPLSFQRLPEGVAAFLRHVNVGGRVLNHPNTGGYLQWRLYPQYKIFMDMQVPFLFKDSDAFLAFRMFRDETIFAELTHAYRPDFVTVPLSYQDFPRLISGFPDYTLVFFDDAEALYVNNRRHPAVARQYALEGIDPFALAQETGTSPSLATESLRSRLQRLIALYPEGFQARRLAAETALEAQAYRRALSHAQAMVRNFPESPEGYVLQGDAYKGLRVHQQALTSYRKALARSRPKRRARIYQKMGSVYMELQRYAEAYRVLKRGFPLTGTM